MAIYKSSFNKKPDKQSSAPKKEKPIKQKQAKVKAKTKANVPLICLIAFAVLFLVCLPPNFIKNFVLGGFGLSVYPVCLLGMFFSGALLSKREFKLKKRYIIYLTVSVVIVWFIFHLILTSRLDTASYGTFLKETYLRKTTAGGLLFSLVSYPIVKLLTVVGAYIFSAIALAIFVGLIVDYVIVDRHVGHKEKSRFVFDDIEDFEEAKTVEKTAELDPQKEVARRRLGLEKGETTILSSTMPNYNINSRPQAKPMSKRDYILTPVEPIIPPENPNDVFLDKTTGYFTSKKVNNQNQTKNVEPVEEKEVIPPPVQPIIEPEYEEPAEEQIEEPEEDKYADIFAEDEGYEELPTEEPEEENFASEEDEQSELADLNEDAQDGQTAYDEIVPNVEESDFVDEYAQTEDNSDLGSTVESEVVLPSVDISKFHLPGTSKKVVAETEQVKIDDIKPKEEIPPYVAPPVNLLKYMENTSKISEEELQENVVRLEQVLEDFKVPAKVNNVQVGPAVTRYELTMPRGISVNKIVQMSDDIAMTLASNGAIRVEAPIPGKNSVGIEVPNNQITPVSLRELIDSNEFKVRANPLSFVLGKDINGDIIFCNLDKMPHLLVAGSTGSGKSVCLNTMLLSMCYKSGPQDLRLILVDPKMVEFSTYSGLPHLLIPEVITGKEMTINALDWAIKEMERRYALFAKNHVVNINEFNKGDAVRSKREQKLPFIVIVVDELADLMLEAKKEIEDRIAKLAAKARAAGIHLVLATQRPSVDVITGTVKANLPSRVAFALTNFMDSKTVLDGGGAEKLLGKGDMLFKPQDKPEPRRVQGAFVSNEEISKVVEFIKEHNKPVYDEDTGKAIKSPYKDNGGGGASQTGGDKQEFDPVLKDALYMFIEAKQASGSMISRRYSVGFNRAGRIMDQMFQAGFIGPPDGSKPRQVLITMDEYNAIFGDKE